MTVSNQLRIENPTADLLEWCKKNLVLANPDYTKKARMNLWLGNTPQKLYLMQWDGDTLVLPYGCFNDVLRLAPFTDVSMTFAPQSKVDFQCNIPLYDYQEKAKDALVESGRGILQSAAGSGKTADWDCAGLRDWRKDTLAHPYKGLAFAEQEPSGAVYEFGPDRNNHRRKSPDW